MRLDEYLKTHDLSQRKLAAALKVSPVMVSIWASGKRRVPAERCPDIERETGGLVRCEDLRPDVAWLVVRGVAGPVSETVCIHDMGA